MRENRKGYIYTVDVLDREKRQRCEGECTKKEDSPKFVETRGCIWMGKADTGIYSAASTSFRELCLAVT